MQCPSLTLQVVGKLCYGGKAMNESSSNLFYAVLPYILRCFIPLAILFGISYLLRRMGLVAIDAPEPKEEAVDKPVKESVKAVSSPKITSQTQPKKPQKRKVSSPKEKSAGKKSATKKKTEKPRSPSK
jgi:hypothetical protein